MRKLSHMLTMTVRNVEKREIVEAFLEQEVTNRKSQTKVRE